MHALRSIAVRDCQGILWALFHEYEGRAQASFEGDLAELTLLEIPGSTDKESGCLNRQTLEPQLDFCIVPINANTIPLLKRRMSASNVLGLHGSIIHTQLAIDNELIFLACDNFHDECSVISRMVPESLLSMLQSNGVVRSYQN